MDPVITVSTSICMSVLFGVAAVHKLQSLAIFRSAMDEYQLIPRSLSGIAAVFVVTAELLAALLVLIPVARAAGLMVMAGLLFVYTAGISINLLRGRRDIDCGCSSFSSRHELSGWLVLRNLLLLGLVLLAWGPASDRPLNWLDLLLIAFGVLITGGLYLSMNQLLAQAPRIARLRSGT
ncbi:MAG TPA: MauE/DoxX family redox-associated membrane protein [Xanthomonadales bacterium]|nr:MauE/DoxX family redox-associated membrane protein [Xanthomonadales bacterium]